MSTVPFTNGEPIAPANSNTSYTDIFTNVDNSACPGNCFRPVGIAFDSQGRMFVSSDASGEIYVVLKDEASNGTFGASGIGSSGSSGSGTSGSDGKTSGAQRLGNSVGVMALAFALFCYAM